MPIPARLQPLLPQHDSKLVWDELVTAVGCLVDAELNDDQEARLVAYLDANLPGGGVQDLIDWPGDWFGNRWLEEVSLSPEDVAYYAAHRAGRELPGLPSGFDPPYPTS